jgi:hypothetical protein
MFNIFKKWRPDSQLTALTTALLAAQTAGDLEHVASLRLRIADEKEKALYEIRRERELAAGVQQYDGGW